MAELDSAINKWIDMVPPHRMCLSLLGSETMTQSILQFNGILIEQIMRSSTSQPLSTRITTCCRFAYIDRSFLLPANLHV